MDNDKMMKIFTEMQGITYLEWRKLFHVIEENFHSRATIENNRISMAAPDDLIASFNRLF